jgi:uncharacterized LabA/DUF88 family protein
MVNNPETIYAFIDSQNLNLSVQKDVYDKNGNLKYKGWRLSFRRFFVYLQDKYKVNIAFLFIGYVKKYESLYRYLRRAGYTIIFKPTIKFNDGNGDEIKGNVDAELVMHTMLEMPNYDKAIIIAGDGDYYCLIKHLESENKLLKLFIPNKFSYSSLLNEFHSYMAYVSDLRHKLEET